MNDVEKQGRYTSYKRGWLAGTQIHLLPVGTPEPDYMDEYERGERDGNDAYSSAMKDRYEALYPREIDPGGGTPGRRVEVFADGPILDYAEVPKLADRKPTGYDKYFAEKMEDPTFREGYEQARKDLALPKPADFVIIGNNPPSCTDCGSTEKDDSIPGPNVYLVHKSHCIQLQPVNAPKGGQ